MQATDESFWRGVELFNAGDYFEAHEVWEEIWTTTEGHERIFFQALIHFAVGCHHLGRGNRLGAARQWAKGVEKMRPFTPEWRGIRTAPLVEAAQGGMGLLPPIEKAEG